VGRPEVAERHAQRRHANKKGTSPEKPLPPNDSATGPRSVGNGSRLACRPENTRFDVDAADGSGREQAQLARGRLKESEVGKVEHIAVQRGRD
jgi:hypothetical protein